MDYRTIQLKNAFTQRICLPGDAADGMGTATGGHSCQ
jgi:hypothetical protein